MSRAQDLVKFEDALSQESLSNSFDNLLVRRYDVIADEPRILPGADRIQLDHFRCHREKHLSAIHRKVLQGRYTFSPTLGVDIPKPGSKETRPLSLSTIRDTVVQRALYDYLYPRIDPLLTDFAFGYRMGRSAHDAVNAIIHHIRNERKWIVDVDLTKFFDTVRHDLLLKKLMPLRIDDRATRLIYRFLRTGRVDATQVAESRITTGPDKRFTAELRQVGVPQGGVLSGLLSNLFLADFDRVIGAKYCGFVRYADDFVVCCSSFDECQSAFDLVKNEIQQLDLTLNMQKTRQAVPISMGIDFLGFRISDKGIRVRGQNISKFKDRIRRVIEKQQRLETPEATLRSLIYRLNFKIRGPNEEQQGRLATKAEVKYPHRRSWIGFFRIVTDINQIRCLDRWIRKEIADFMWYTHRHRVRYSDLSIRGLQTLVKWLFKSRRK